MKRIFARSKLALAGLIVMSVIFSPLVALQAYAAGYLTLSSFSGNPGTTLTVSGGGLNANEHINVYVGTVSGTPVASTDASASGDFSTSVSIPSNAPQGPLNIIGVDSHNNQLTNSYYVVPLQASITVTAPSHAPFAVLTIDGSGFAANETVTLSLAGASTQIPANASGNFTGAHLTVPMVTSGLYIVQAIGNNSGARSTDYLNYFWIDEFYPSVAPSSYYLVPGSTLTFTGSGFAPNETITVTETGTSNTLSTFTADATGSFTAAGGFALPVSFQNSTRNFTLTGSQSHQSASTGMTVGGFWASVTPSAYWLLPGAKLTFTGSGFAAGETVSVYKGTESSALTTVTVDTNGGFLNLPEVQVPFESAGGSAAFRFVGNASHAESTASISVGNFYPSLSPSSYWVMPNSTITLSGTGFAAGETVTIGTSGATTTSTVTADTNGAFSAPVLVPFSKTGSATFTATGSISKNQTSVGVTLASFYPSITPSTYYTFPGSAVTFTGSGFVPNETVTISSGTGSSTTITTDNLGGFTTSSFTIPFGSTNSVAYTFSGELSNNPVTSSIALGTLSAFLTSDAYFAYPFQNVNVTGYGFASGEQVVVTAGSFVATTTADAQGNVSAVAIPVPAGLTSALAITFTGQSSHAVGTLSLGVGSTQLSVTPDTYYAAPGSQVTFTGSGYTGGEVVTISLNGTAVASSTTSAAGVLKATVMIPYGLSGSTAHFTFVGNQTQTTSAIDIALAPVGTSVTPSSFYLTPGSNISFTGAGFAPNETISVTLNDTNLTSTTTNASGALTYSTTIPLGASKNAHFVFTGATSGVSVPVEISLAEFFSSLQLSTYYSQAGLPIMFTGSGFGPNEQVEIKLGDASAGTTNADASGSFTYSSTIPYSPAGGKTFTATGATTKSIATAPITIAPSYISLQLASYADKPGARITFIGSGYFPHETINVTSDRGNASTSFTTDANGSFNDSSLVIPADMAEGQLVLTVKSATSNNTQVITYYVTGQ